MIQSGKMASYIHEDSSVKKSAEPRNGMCETIPSSFEWIKSEAPGFSACGSQVNLFYNFV